MKEGKISQEKVTTVLASNPGKGDAKWFTLIEKDNNRLSILEGQGPTSLGKTVKSGRFTDAIEYLKASYQSIQLIDETYTTKIIYREKIEL